MAERLFIQEGVGATTTNAIATQAQVPIGSLYQFFPDKAAILQALAARYTTLFNEQLFLMEAELEALPLSDVLGKIIDASDQFFVDYPGYHAIFMQMQGSIPELSKIEEAADVQLIDRMAQFLSRRSPVLDATDCQAIAFVLVKATCTLLWLSLRQDPAFKQRLVAETKRLVSAYAQSYWPEEGS